MLTTPLDPPPLFAAARAGGGWFFKIRALRRSRRKPRGSGESPNCSLILGVVALCLDYREEPVVNAIIQLLDEGLWNPAPSLLHLGPNIVPGAGDAALSQLRHVCPYMLNNVEVRAEGRPVGDYVHSVHFEEFLSTSGLVGRCVVLHEQNSLFSLGLMQEWQGWLQDFSLVGLCIDAPGTKA